MQAMIGKMAKMYPMLIMLGFAIVILSFLIGIDNSNVAADYFSVDKVTRETTLMTQRASIESTGFWLSPFKFLGLGLILGGIVMALRVIIDNLRNVGKQVLPSHLHDSLPTPPWFGLMMPMVMMLGMVVFIGALIVGAQTAGVASDVFANPAPVIDAAGVDNNFELLAKVQQIHATKSWLVPLKFWGVALEFLAIAMGLATIVFILDRQTEIIDDALHRGIT